MSFAERAERALADANLQLMLRRGTDYATGRRLQIFERMGDDAEAYRRRTRAIRERVLSRLDEYAREFATAATRAGANVQFASDGDEACRMVLEIAQARRAKLAVKMKSMLTEEIHLRDALEAGGVKPVETDLGEWIIQLAKETPSHILAPAMHKPKKDVKALFDLHLGPDPREDAESLVARARLHLRQQFLDADLGITGCNFAVARTGTLVLVSNEGNGRLTASAPPVHIALVPVEKLVPTLDDAATLVRMLIHAAIGQKLTAYVNFVTGPKRASDLDGPEELHVILVDSGRSQALDGPLRDALLCIRCGACLNICPVFRRVGGQTYEATYSGPIGIAVNPIVRGGSAHTDELAHASTLCRACHDACPVGIDLPKMILEARRLSVEAKRPPLATRALFAAWTAIVRQPLLYRAALKLARLVARRFSDDGRVTRFPGLDGWMATRDLPEPAAVPFRERMRRHGR